MRMNLVLLSISSLILLQSNLAQAKEILVQARLFVGSTSINPDNLNDSLEADGLEKMDGITHLGVEITYPVLKYLDVGARYTKKYTDSEENPANPATNFTAELSQDNYLLIARVPVVRSDSFRFDVFAGVGGTNTNVKLKTISQNGELTKGIGNSWYSSPYAAAGVSVGMGFKKVYVVVEGGYEHNKVDGFKRSGNPNANIDDLDLSGGYFTIGLMFDGIPGTTK